MTELKDVGKQLEILRQRQMQLEAENFQQKLVPLLESSIGKTFVYRNSSYSGNEKWDVFRKLLGVVFSEYHAWAIFEECQIDSDGRAKLENHSELVGRADQGLSMIIERGWKECPSEEYEARRRDTLAELSNPKRMRALLAL